MRASILTAAALLATAASFGCGGTPPPQTTINEQHNVLPTGSIQGRVTDAMTGVPLGGVKVRTIASTALSATTDPDGFYIINNVPAGGSYTVYFEADGYVRRMLNTQLTGDVGNYPTGNAVATQNAVLAKGDGEVKGFVLGAQGQPAAGASVVADLRPQGFDLIVSTKAGANGSFDLAGLPGFPAGLDMAIVVPPYDENNDGSPEYDLTTAAVRVFGGVTSFRLISIAPNGVGILSTNVADQDLLPTDPIKVTFTAPMNEAVSTATLRDTSRNLNVGVTRSWENGLTLVVAPAASSKLTEGDNYDLVLSAVAQNGGTLNITLPFKVRNSPITVNNAIITGLKIDSPTLYDWTTSNYALSWNADVDAAGYKVYVKDINKAPSFVQVAATVGTSPTPSASVTLPNAYDVFTADSYFTPLAFANKVTFAVVSVDRYGNEGSLANANTVQVGDNVAPNVVFGSPSQSGNANNFSSSPVKVLVNVTFDEYMDVNTAPVMNITTGGLIGATSTWAWDPSMMSGSFTLSVPPNTDARGNITITGARDSSGNPMTDVANQLR